MEDGQIDRDKDLTERISALEAERRALIALSIGYDQMLDGLVRTRRYRLAQAIGNVIETIPARPRAWLERIGRATGGQRLLQSPTKSDRLELERDKLQQRLHAMLYANAPAPDGGLPHTAQSALPLVSVVSVLHNSAATIRDFLRAFFAQYYGGTIEIVLVDDASTDDSSALVAAFTIASPASQRTVRVLRNNANLGNCLSRNAAVAAAGGDIICILYADCIVNEGFVAAHVAMHASGRDVVIGPMGIESMGEPVALEMAELLADQARLRSRMRLQDPTNLESSTNTVTRNFGITARRPGARARAVRSAVHLSRRAGHGVWLGRCGDGRGAATLGHPRRLHLGRHQHTHQSPSTVSDRTRALGSARNFALLIEAHPHLLVEARDWAKTTAAGLPRGLRAPAPIQRRISARRSIVCTRQRQHRVLR